MSYSDKLVHIKIENRRAESTGQINISLGIVNGVKNAKHHKNVGILKIMLTVRF